MNLRKELTAGGNIQALIGIVLFLAFTLVLVIEGPSVLSEEPEFFQLILFVLVFNFALGIFFELSDIRKALKKK